MLAVATVHTAGVNIESLTIIVCSILGTVGGGVAWIVKVISGNRAKTQAFIVSQVQAVTSSLTGRLDTLDQHLAEQDKTVFAQNERLARVEGRLSVPPAGLT